MALVPVYEEIAISNEVILPGSVYNEVSHKFGPGGRDDIEMKYIMECDVNCSTGQVLQALRESKAHKESLWVQDLGTTNSKNVIFIEVVKTRETKASKVEFHDKPVVTSVISKCEGTMVLIFSQPIDAQKIPDLQCIIRDALVKDIKPYISKDLDTYFESANFYHNFAKPSNKSSLKVSLEEFCFHINSFVHRYVTSAIVLRGYNAMDVTGTKEITRQTEKIRPHINPTEHASKDISYFVDQKHQADLDNHNSTLGKDTFRSVNHFMNDTVLNTEVQDKTPDTGSQRIDQQDSQRNDQECAKTLLNQHCSSDVYKMGQCHREENLTHEFVSHGNHSTAESIIKDPLEDLVQFCSGSGIRNMYPLLDKKEEPMNTECDVYSSHCHQDNNTLTLYSQSVLTSDKCSVSDGKHLVIEHCPVNPKSRHTKFHSMKEIACHEDCSGIRRKYFGLKSTSKEEKVIILIGNKGSGKTTLINFAANFFKGIETVDDKLFLVTMNQIYEESHTYSMTAYTFCFAEDDVPITIIDTPGLEDRGTEENIPLQELKTFFTSNSSNIQLHAIGYVISSNAVCLTSPERHIIDFLTEYYGQGISTNFFTFVTFDAEIGKHPFSDIFKSCGIKSKVFLKFNNTAFSMKELDDFDEFYWKQATKNWKKCIKVLKELPPLTIKTLRVKQKQIYSTYLIRSLEDKLKNELKEFILSFKETNSLTQLIQEKSEQVWQSTVALYHLLSINDCSFSNFESVLVKYVDEVAKKNSFSSKNCVMLLSLCPSRGLLEAGKRVIECLGPVYYMTKSYGLQNPLPCKKPDILFCRKCSKQHRIQRVENKSKKSDVIIYQCSTCSCDESQHIKTPVPRRHEKKYDLPRDCLKHTKSAIESILQDFSVPGHVLDIRTYLEYVSLNLDEQFKDFIDCILNL